MSKTKVYEPEFKKKIVRLYLEEGRTIMKYSQQSRHIFKTYFTEDGIKLVPNKWIPFHLVLDSQENHEVFENCRILPCIQKQTDAVH